MFIVERNKTLWSDEELDGAKEMNERQLAYKLTRIYEEIKLGDWDYDRLLPERAHYMEVVARWKGVVKFNFPQNKNEAIEARAIVRFLNTWKTRKGDLEDMASQTEFLIKGKS